MVRTFLLTAVTGGLLAIPGGVTATPPAAVRVAQVLAIRQAPPEINLSTAEKIVSALQSIRISYEKDLQTTPLSEVLSDLGTRYQVTFVIDKTAFADAADQLPDAKATKLATTKLEGMVFGPFLDIYLRGLNVPDVTYLVRPGYVEITTRPVVQKEAGLTEAIDEAGKMDDPIAVVRAKARLNLPLVCVAVENKSLAAVLADLSRVYGLNVMIDPQVHEQVKFSLTERLLNVPADTALELLAGQAGLSVVRKGNVFRVTNGGAQ